MQQQGSCCPPPFTNFGHAVADALNPLTQLHNSPAAKPPTALQVTVNGSLVVSFYDQQAGVTLLEPVEVPARAFPEVGARVLAGMWVSMLDVGQGTWCCWSPWRCRRAPSRRWVRV